MPLNKQQLEAVNQNNFPDNNTQLITPALLREFNTDIIDSIQLTGSYATTGSNTFVGNQTINGDVTVTGVISASVLYVQTETASVIYSSGSNQFGDELSDVQTLSGSVKIQGTLLINGLPIATGSVTINTGSFVTTSSFNAYTASNNQRVSSLEANSASVNISITNVNSATASLFTSVNSLNQFTQSQSQLNGTFATTGSNTFTGNQIIDRASKLYTNGIYWTDPTAGFNNLEIINQSGGNLDLASLNGGKVRIVNTPLVLTGSALTSSNDISTSANIYAANLTGSGTIPAGTISSSAQITGLGFVSSSVTASSIVDIFSTLADNQFTYTKGDGSQQTVTLNSSGGGSVPAGTISGSQQITNLGFVSSSVTASSLITASLSGQTITFTKGDSSTFGIVLPSGSVPTDITALNAFTASQETKNATLANVTSSINSATASLFTSASLSLTTASFSGNTLTFRKGDGTTFGVVIPDVSGSTGNFATTGSNTFNGTQIINGAVTASSLQINGITDLNGVLDVSNDATFRGNVLIQSSGEQKLLMRSTSGGGVSQGFDLLIQTSSFIIRDETHDIDFLEFDYISSSAQHILKLEANRFELNSGSLGVSGSFTASLQEGYVWAGGAGNISKLVATSSFEGGGTINTSSFVTTSSFNAYTSSTNSRLTNIESTTASLLIETQNLELFSASALSSISQLNASSASQQISINNLNTTTASINSSITQLNASSASQQTQINSLIAATSSYVTSAITASSLVTASFSGNTLTFTKGDSSTFGVVIPDVSGSTINTGSFATTGSNTFVGQQNIANANKIGFGTTPNDVYINSPFNGLFSVDLDIVNYSSAGGVTNILANNGVNINAVNSNVNITGKTGVNVYGNTFVSGALNITGSLTSSLQQGFVLVGDASGRTQAVATSSFSGGTINTGSFATTGSNVFTGEQTLSDEAGNTVTLSDISGSLVLVNKGSTSGSAGLSNLSASLNQVNLIFKAANNQSGSLTISGSGNILISAAAPTAGFRRQVNSANILLTAGLPEITGSTTTPVGISNNIGSSQIRWRGPVSSSTWAISSNFLNAALNIGSADGTPANQAIAGGTIVTNLLLGGLNYNSFTTPLSASANFISNITVGATILNATNSAIQANNNIFNGNTFTVNNSYFGTSATRAAQRLALAYNVFGGINSSTLTTGGSNTTAGNAREVIGNTTNGSGILLGAVLDGDNSNLYSTLIHGSNLTVTGSSTHNNYATAGGAFIGRNNDINGTKARSAETVFAVGTGTSTGARKTGFLIDSGSNTFVEGTLNVSGSTSFNGAVSLTGSLNITGSLTSSLTEGYVWVGGAGNISTLAATSSFGGGGTIPAGTVSSSAQILNYNIFATTGSNQFNGGQTIKSQGGLTLSEATGGDNNFINLASLNKATLYIQNVSLASPGNTSGSVLQLTTATGSNGFGGSGSAAFQMDAEYSQKRASLKVTSIDNVGSTVIGIAENIRFVGKEGFSDTAANLFRVEATSIELSGSIKLPVGADKPAGIASVSVDAGGAGTFSNSLINSNSVVLISSRDTYRVWGGACSAGSMAIGSSIGSTSVSFSYLIINPI